MGNDDSVQIAATSSGRRRALARMWRGERASGREMVGGIVVPVGAAPIARNRKSAWRPTGKFSALQSLENSQNAEGISVLREPVPQAGRTLAASRGACPDGFPQDEIHIILVIKKFQQLYHASESL